MRHIGLAVGLLVALGNIGLCYAGEGGALLPQGWRGDWERPGVEMRPLQIVHGVGPDWATVDGMKALEELGLGGIVCNVAFGEYMDSAKNWEVMEAAVRACAEIGMRVWIYDEDGYPSGAAGGQVLRKNMDFEALAMTYDAGADEPFALRASYEHTHASNNFYAARRYPNLIDDKAMQCFVEVTHEAYWKRLKDYFGSTVEAFFTDEPSLMAVNIGPLGDDIKSKVRVVDAVDEAGVKPLPSVPWVRDLPRVYRQRYGQDIEAVRASLFGGDSEADRHVRRRFWALVSEMMAQRYFGKLQDWAHAHHVAASGHTLWEEQLLHHVPLMGNALQCLMRMDIPGLDMLSSDPEAVIYTGWLTGELPGSAAMLSGGRRVMTEVSDFAQTLGGGEAMSLEHMQATAAWQAAFGVTEFTLYYNRHKRTKDEYRAYGDYVGRLNAMLRQAQWRPAVLLYYPIYDLWAEYRPVAEKLMVDSQSARAQAIVRSFMGLGQAMVRQQVTFALADHELLAAATVSDGNLAINGKVFAALVLPDGVQLPESAKAVVEQFSAGGGKVLRTENGAAIDCEALRAVSGDAAISPGSDRIVVGRFRRDGRNVLLVVNVGKQAYSGVVTPLDEGRWLVGRPDSGVVKAVEIGTDGQIEVELGARRAVLLLGPQGK